MAMFTLLAPGIASAADGDGCDYIQNNPGFYDNGAYVITSSTVTHGAPNPVGTGVVNFAAGTHLYYSWTVSDSSITARLAYLPLTPPAQDIVGATPNDGSGDFVLPVDARSVTPSGSKPGAGAGGTVRWTLYCGVKATQQIASATGTVGTPMTFIPVTAKYGYGTRTFALSGGTLPAGLSFNTSTGQITGTPTTTLATTNFTVTASHQGTGTDQQTFALTVNPPPPTVSGITPANGPLGGSTPVTITGTGFLTINSTGAVKFGANNATYTVNSDTQISATSPSGSAGTVDVTVTNVSGASATSSADQFTYVAPPTVTTVAPSSGPLGGTNAVVISGTGFLTASSTGAVTFGGTNATYNIDSDTQITATAPAGTGTVDVVVTNVGGASAITAADHYTYVAAPTVSSIAPTSGPTTSGTSVVITGTGFLAAPSTGAVKFGATTATYSIDSDTQITASAPSGSAGTTNVTVTTPGGTSATSGSTQYTRIAAPTVTNLSVGSGPTAGGTTVVLTGTDFTGVTAVSFGATAAATYNVDSTTQITATTPTAGAAGPVNVRVAATGGTSPTAPGNVFTFVAPPTIGTPSPASGPLAGGGTVTLTGTNLTGATLTVDGVTQTPTTATATSIAYTAPSHVAGAVTVQVTTVGGSASTTYTYVAAPTIGAPSPASGPTSGGTTVTLTGTNLTGATLTVDGGSVTPTSNSGTTLVFDTPAHAGAGAVTVQVTTAGGSASASFTYVAPPVASPYTAGTVAYNVANTNFSIAGAATNSPTSFAVGSATTANGGSVSVDSAGLVTYSAPTGFRGDDSFTFTATNLGGTSNSATVTVPVGNPTLSSSLTGSGTRGTALSGVQIVTTGGTSPYTCATTLASGALPAGTQLNSNCTITGTPAASGPSFTFTANVTDNSTGTGGGFTQTTGTLTLSIAAPTIAISPAAGALPGATVGTAYGQSFTASGGTAGYTYALASGSLPTGVTLSGNTISGTPSAVGTFNFDITATDGSTVGSGGPYSRTLSYSVMVSTGTQTITFNPLSNASLSASPLTLSATASSGLTVSFASTTTGICTVSGTTLTLLQTGTCSITASQAGDSNWIAASDVVRSFTVTPANLTISNSAATGAAVGASYSQANPAAGGVSPYTYSLLSGSFPAGTTLNPGTGTVSGTPTLAGSYSYQLRVSDSQGPAVTADGVTVSGTIAKGTQTITTDPALPGSVGVGSTPYTLADTVNSGLTITYMLDGSSSGCSLSGGTLTFTSTGTCRVNASQAGDSNWNPASTVQHAITISPAGAISVSVGFSTSTLRVGQTGTATITFTNPNASASPNIAPLFNGSALLNRGPLGGSCGASGSDSGANFQFNGFSIPASGSCTVTLNYSGATPGSIAGLSLSAFTPSGYPTTGLASSGGFVVVPALDSISPNAGPVSQVVTLAGAGFSTTPGNNSVDFGGSPGTVTGASATSLTVTAPATGSGAKSVTVTVNGQTSNAQTFTFIDPPTAGNTSASVAYNTATPIDLTSFIAGGPHSSVAASTPTNGTTTVSGNIVTYTPNSGHVGGDSFTYTATGAGGTSNVATVTITVAPPAAPVAADKSGVAVPYNGTGTAIDLSASITGVHTGITAGQGANGTTSVAGDVVTYTPNAGHYGADSFTYTATGPGGTSNVATVSVTVGNPPAPVTTDLNGVSVPYASTGTAIDLTGSVTGVSTSITVTAGPAHGTTTVSGYQVTYTPNAGHYGADSFTYTATGPGGTSNSSTVNLTVATPGAPTTAAVSGVAVPYASTGTAIDLSASITGVHSSIAIAAAPSHGSVTIAGDVVTYTPNAGHYGADSFTYTATGPGGVSNASVVSLTVATPPAPVAADKPGVAVPYASTGTAIDLSASITGVHSSIAIGTAPAHGTVTIAGDVVTYTPAATYYGADSFTYTATGPGGTSSAATVTLSVANPPAPVAADKSGVAVPYASAGTAIDLSASITGVRASIAIGTAPAHGTVTIAGEVVTYTPAATYYGADSFTYTATGPGGTSAPATVSVTVATPAAPTTANKTGVTVAYNSTGTAIDLAGSVTGVHNALTITTAPTHGTATVNGDVVTYVPTAGYYGADSFGYTATGPGGTSAAATVSLTVATPPPPVAAPGTGSVAGSTTTAGTSVNIDLSALVTGVYDTIQIATPPAHGTVTLSGGGAARPAGKGDAAPATPIIATYTPAPNYAGTDSFTFVAVGPGGTSAPGTVTITVVGQVPIPVAKVASTGDGQMVSVMLTDGAIRGPFTGANVVSVSPANAATTAIVASGAGTSATYRLDITPSNRFGGTIVVTYTLSNIYGTSAPSTVTLTVQARPDPRNDPNVGAISDAQSEAARRFARAQVSNFMRRTEQLHNGGGQAGMTMGMTLTSNDVARMERPDDSNWGLAITERMRVSGEDPAIGQFANNPQSPLSRADQIGFGRAVVPTGTGAAANGSAKAAAETNEDGTRRTGSVATWAGGAIDIGTRDRTTDRDKVTATTAGLSAGADVKLADGVVVGLGGGYGNDLSRIGTGAQVRGTSTLYAAYASLQPAAGMFIDGVVGRGQLDFTTRRIAAAVNATARGSRDGSYTVAAISLGVDRNDGALQWSIYGRGEYLDADLDAYTESGAGRYNLRFDARQVRSLTGTLGGRIEYRQKVDFGSITPRVRAEWNHEFADVDAQWLDYADIPGAAAYALTGNGWKREQLQLSLGTRFDILSGGWSFDFETGLRAGQGEKAGTLQIRVSKQF